MLHTLIITKADIYDGSMSDISGFHMNVISEIMY